MANARVQKVMANLNKCMSAMELENEMAMQMQESFLQVGHPLLACEDSLLNLTSCETISDIFYCCVVRIGEHYECRILEYGKF